MERKHAESHVYDKVPYNIIIGINHGTVEYLHIEQSKQIYKMLLVHIILFLLCPTV